MEEYKIDCINNLYKILRNKTKSKLIEDSIARFTNDLLVSNNLDKSYFSVIYNNKLDDILMNLKKSGDIKNNYLSNAIKKKEIDINNLAFLSGHKLFPNKWKKILDRLELIQCKKTNIITTDIFTCYECGKNKTHVHQKQTRSADEPMTTFVFCVVCRNEWSFNC